MYNPIYFNDEIFKDILISNIMPIYKISNYGTIINKNSNSQVSQSLTNDGYLRVSLKMIDGSNKHYLVHRLVLMVFCPIENPENFEVNHIHGIKNDNRVSQLEWVTTMENNHHAFRTGLNNNIAENHANAVLSNSEVIKICELLSLGTPIHEICNIMNNIGLKDPYRSIIGILNRDSWTSISKDYIFPEYKNLRNTFTDKEVHSICAGLQNDLGYKDILLSIGINISLLSQDELENYCNIISNIRIGKYYKNISKDYNLISTEKDRSDQLFTFDQIEIICKLLSEGKDYSSILNYFNINKNNCDSNKYDAYRHCLYGIKNRRKFIEISSKYIF